MPKKIRENTNSVKILASEARVAIKDVAKICVGLSPEDVLALTHFLSGAMTPPLWAMGLVRDLRALQEEGRDESSGGR